MLDVHFPTTDGQELVFCRYTQPEKDHRMLPDAWDGTCHHNLRQNHSRRRTAQKLVLVQTFGGRMSIFSLFRALYPPVAKSRSLSGQPDSFSLKKSGCCAFQRSSLHLPTLDRALYGRKSLNHVPPHFLGGSHREQRPVLAPSIVNRGVILTKK